MEQTAPQDNPQNSTLTKWQQKSREISPKCTFSRDLIYELQQIIAEIERKKENSLEINNFYRKLNKFLYTLPIHIILPLQCERD